jgi:tetratricopeptide (TPR) repeat protein
MCPRLWKPDCKSGSRPHDGTKYAIFQTEVLWISAAIANLPERVTASTLKSFLWGFHRGFTHTWCITVGQNLARDVPLNICSMLKTLFEVANQARVRAWRKCGIATAGLFVAMTAMQASAHPEFDAQIAGLTELIEKDPVNAELYLRRADIRRQHQEFEAALVDVATAARLKRDWPRVSLVRGQIQFDARHPKEALRSVEQFLRTETNHIPALLLRARCERQLDKPELAVADYDAALEISVQPNPDLFVERAQLEAALGRFNRAIEGLDEGMRRLGAAPGLQMAALDLERQTGRFDAALRRIEKMAKEGSNSPAQLLLKAEVLEQAGRLTSAREVLRKIIAISQETGSYRGAELAQCLQKAREGLDRIQRRLSRS